MGFTRTIAGAGGRFDWHRGGKQDQLWFFCPGCNLANMLPVSGSGAWRWDGNLDAPTLEPSILCLTGKIRCHSFMRAGRLQFLDDCTHALRGQTIDVPVLPDWMRD